MADNKNQSNIGAGIMGAAIGAAAGATAVILADGNKRKKVIKMAKNLQDKAIKRADTISRKADQIQDDVKGAADNIKKHAAITGQSSPHMMAQKGGSAKRRK